MHFGGSGEADIQNGPGRDIGSFDDVMRFLTAYIIPV